MKINVHNLRKAEQGFAHIFLVLLLVGGVAVGGFAVWRISSYNDNSGENANGRVENDGSGNNTATVSAECVAMTGDANICHLGAIDSLDKHASVIKVTMEGADGKSQVWTQKYDGKGNNTVSSGDIKGISLNGHYYVFMGDKWIDNGGSGAQAPSAPAAPALATTAGIKYENLGKVACGDDTCFKYRCTGGILGASKVVVTFGTEDYLPRHYDITTPKGEASLLGNMTMDIKYGPVTITAPSGAITMEQYQQQLLGN